MKKQEKLITDQGNSNIKCGVDCCAYHNPTNHCSLQEIQVGPCASEVTQCKNTECASFQMENEGCCR